MSEFKIRLQTEIDSSKAESQLQKLQSVADKKKIKLNVEVNDLANSNGQLNKIKTSLSKAFKLDSSSLSGLKQVQSALKEVNKLINQTSTNKKATNSIISQYKQLASESIAIQKQMSKTVDVNAYKALEQQLSYVISKMNTLKSTMNNTQISSLEVFDDKIARNLERSYVSSFSKIQSEVVKLETKLASLGKSGYTDKSKISALVSDLSKIKDIDLNNLSSSGLKTLATDLEQIKNKIKDVENGAKELKFKDKLQLDTSKVQNDLNKLRQSCENVGKSTSGIDKLENELRQLSNLPMDQVPTALSKIKTEVNSMKSSLSGLNVTTKETSSFFRELYSSFSTFGLANILADGLKSAVRSVKDTVIELDNSFRDLMKVAPDTFKGTREELNQLRDDAISAGIEVARSSNDIIDGTSKAFQLGIKNVKDALEYSKQASQFANVADLDQENANSYLASITAAYGGAANALKPLQGELQKTGKEYNTLTKFADLANYAGNNFAITTGDVGDALSRSASLLSSLGTPMQDSIALIVGMQEVVQDSQKTGTSLKAIASNLSSVKVSLKDGSITANKTNKAFKELAGIDIWDKQSGEIKSTMDVLTELSEKWDSLTMAEKTALSESMGGKEHINAVIGLMDNWEQVVKYQQDYNQGLMKGSAEKENARFVDSIEGRLVRLSEEFKKLTTTLVTTDMFKSLVTGAADFLSILNNIISAFDKVGMGTPLLAGTVTSLFSLIKAKGTGTDLPNYFGSLINGFNSLSDKSTVTSARISKANNTISKSFVSTGNSLSSINGQTIKYTATANNLSKIQSKQAPILKNTANGYSTLTVATKNSMKSIVTATAKNALMSTGLTLLNGAFVGLAIAGVGAAVKAFDNYINRVDIAREKNQERIDEINTEISSYQTQKSGLKSIQKEYDELNNKTNRTKEESERLLELNQELAQLMPELVSGYDEAGNPIINMRGDVADLISDLDLAIERKNQLLASEKREQAELAIEKLNEVEVGGLGGGANVYYDTAQEKLNAIQEEYNTKLRKIQKDRDDILDKMGKSDTKKREQYQQKLRKNLQQELDLQNEYVSKYEEKYSEIQTLTNEISEGVFSGVKTSSMFTNDFSDEVKKQLLGLQDSLDFSELETSDDINKAKQAILELGTAAATGKVDLTDLKKTVDDTNQQFEDGQISYTEYTQKLNELSETIGELTNTDPSFWRNMFEGMSEGSLTASRDLESFLKTFDKTRKDLINGDSVAAGLERQFRAVSSAFDELSNLPADVGIEPIISISNSADIPKEISYLLKRLVADNDFSMEDQKIALDVMLAYQQGDSSGARKIIEEINKDLKSQGLPEIDADVLFNAKVDTTEIENQLKKYKNVNSREEIKTLFTSEVVGLDKLELYEETIKKLPANKDNTTRFLAECYGDLEELNSYEEVSKWLMANPEILTKYNIDLQGSEGIIQVHNELSKLPIEKSVLVNVEKGLAEGNIDSVASAIASLPPEKRLQVIAAIEQAMGNISTVDQKKLKDKLTTLRADATKATKTIDTVEGKKINDKTFTVTAKDKSTGVLSGIKGWLDSIFSKTITVTTNKVTKSTFVGSGGGHAAEGISVASLSADTSSLSRSVEPNEISILSDEISTRDISNTSTVGNSRMSSVSETVHGSDSKNNNNMVKQTKLIKDQSDAVIELNKQMLMLNILIDNAFGEEKNILLKERNNLINQQNEEINGIDFRNANLDKYINQLDNLHESINISDLSKTANMVNDYIKNMPDVSKLLQVTLDTYVPNVSNSNSSSVQFNSPLIVVEGNADANTVTALEEVSDKLVKKIIAKIESSNSKTKRLEGRI